MEIAADLTSKIRARFPDAEVTVQTRDGRHFEASIVTSAFEGQTLLHRQRQVYAVFQEELTSGRVHAFSMVTQTPEERKAALLDN